MLDLRFVRENPELVREAMLVDQVVRLDEERRSLLQEVEPLRSQRTSISKKIGGLKDKKGAEAERLSTGNTLEAEGTQSTVAFCSLLC
jgi:seryl-tRNA synthetase